MQDTLEIEYKIGSTVGTDVNGGRCVGQLQLLLDIIPLLLGAARSVYHLVVCSLDAIAAGRRSIGWTKCSTGL